MAHRIIPPYVQIKENQLLISNYDFEMYNTLIKYVTNLTDAFPIKTIKCHQQLIDWIIQKTPKLNDTNDFIYSIQTRCRWILSGRMDFPICRFCHKQFGMHKNLPIRYDYSAWCSNKCRQTDPIIVARTKATKFKNYGDENYCNPDKAKQTFLINYGVTNPNKCKATREKIKQTCLNTYGYENVSQFSKVKEKIKQTNLERRGVTSSLADPKVRAKGMETSLKVYGTKFPAQSDIIKQRMKKGFVSHYGVDHNMKSKEGLAHWKQCFKSKYGVDNPFKCPEIRELIRRKYVYNNIQFDSAPELAFYIWLKDVDIEFEYQPKISFTYEYIGKKHLYFPDFKVGDMYFEIKGDQFFNLDGTMTCPYRKKNMTDEEYAHICKLYEVKHQCMLQNGVIILKYAEYSIFLCYISQTYGKDYLQQFRASKN